MKLLIDAEYYLYVAAAGAEYEAEWGADDWTYVCRHGDAKAAFQETIGDLREACPGHTPVMVFGDTFSFRYGIWPAYKANRKKRRRPAGYRQLQDWVVQGAASRGWEVAKLPDVEGDGGLGILYQEGDIIAAVDKDLLSVPGWHLRDGKVTEVTELEANLSFYQQVLTGDSCDNYPGLPGCGPVAATKALLGCSTEQDMWRQVMAQYRKKDYSEPYVISQARCARILRPGEYDHEKKSPILWNPPVA